MNSDHLQVYVVGRFDGLVATMFRNRGWRGTRDIAMADLVVFTGGADINPAIYNEPVSGAKYIDEQRDAEEMAVYKAALNWNIPMLGICRGAQLLNCMNGGSLWQDVNNHTANHWIVDTRTDATAFVTSTHHQQMRINPKTGHMIAVAYNQAVKGRKSLCTRKAGAGVTQIPHAGDVDPEVVWYADTSCLCFQPHPEYPGNTDTANYFWSLFEELFDFGQSQAQESAS